MTQRNRPILDALKRLVADGIEHCRLFLHTNTFLNCVLFGGAAFLSNLPAEWLKDRPWLPPTVAALIAISVKITQQVTEAAEKKPNG
jgi:hypothetical protein